MSQFPAPVSVMQICEFVGLFNYFRFLILNLAFYSGLLTNLTWQKLGYSGGPLPPLALSAFSHLKRQLCAALVSHPRRGFTFHLAMDAAAGDKDYKGGFGAVLTKMWEDGKEHVIEEKCAA